MQGRCNAIDYFLWKGVGEWSFVGFILLPRPRGLMNNYAPLGRSWLDLRGDGPLWPIPAIVFIMGIVHLAHILRVCRRSVLGVVHSEPCHYL